MVSKNTICLRYGHDALDTANFYAQIFPDGKVTAARRAPSNYPTGKEDGVLTMEFTAMDIPCLGLNDNPQLKRSEAFSFQIVTDDQAGANRPQNAIVSDGGQESACGWCKDKWGLSRQITPRALTAAYTDPDHVAAKRAFGTTMTTYKIDIATIEVARRG